MLRVALAVFLLTAPLSMKAEARISEFAENVTTHLLMHELAHALIREFDLPVLGNEENIADSFATLFIEQTMPDRAEAIIKDRTRFWLAEARARGEINLKGEHAPDARRAYRAACWLYGADPEAFPSLPSWAGLSDQDAYGCADAAPELLRSWRRVLRPNMMPDGMTSSEFRVVYEDGPMTAMVEEHGLLEEVGDIIGRFDWHSLITLHFDRCDKGAYWRRNGRTIVLCDEYFMHIMLQEPKISDP